EIWSLGLLGEAVLPLRFFKLSAGGSLRSATARFELDEASDRRQFWEPGVFAAAMLTTKYVGIRVSAGHRFANRFTRFGDLPTPELRIGGSEVQLAVTLAL
ncbi:MAG: hypothetical protein AAF658_10530, partial [Myxococcota bacterium]